MSIIFLDVCINTSFYSCMYVSTPMQGKKILQNDTDILKACA